ncbi:MAG: GNAT family N-acetyltransferase [Actinophytocola sp.]|nr:GNAT family N-acetyltransferase [Actinophytocola sp.]
MFIREATADDWAAIWPFLRQIVAEGMTFTWDPDVTEARARATWMHEPPGRTLVAVDGETVLGTAEIHRNQAGPGAHVANAGFMVDPAHAGKGVGRALGEAALATARSDGYRAMQFNAVVETNTGAIALWQSLGFEILTTVPEAFHHPDKGYVGLHVMYQRL